MHTLPLYSIRQFNKCVKNSAKSSVRLVLLRETETMYNGKLQRGIEYTEHKRPCIIYWKRRQQWRDLAM